MTKKPDPYHIKGARNDAGAGEPIPLDLSGNPAEVYRALAASAGEHVVQSEIDAFAAYCATTAHESARILSDYNRSRPRYVDATMRDGRIVRCRLN